MAERLSEIEGRHASVEDLGTVTDAMRSLAAVRLQQALAMLGGTRTYASVIADALAQAVELPGDAAAGWPAAGRGQPAILLFAPEHGFVGAFAERLVEAALAAPADHALWVVGSRAAALLEEHGRPAAWSLPMATHTDGVTDTGDRVAAALYRAAAENRLGRVELIYGRTTAGAPPELVREALLPLALDRLRPVGRAVPPLTNLPPAALVGSLLDEYVFALLAHAAMESFAAENAARLAVMMTVRHNIETTLDELATEMRTLRQEQITTELIELVAGADLARLPARKRVG